MLRLCVLCAPLLMGACAGTSPVAHVGMSFGPNGLRVAPSVGVAGANASVMVYR